MASTRALIEADAAQIGLALAAKVNACFRSYLTAISL
jgi:hypothetical protein